MYTGLPNCVCCMQSKVCYAHAEAFHYHLRVLSLLCLSFLGRCHQVQNLIPDLDDVLVVLLQVYLVASINLLV
jgi:hypothetical protein